MRLLDDDLDGARRDLESVTAAARRLGILNTATTHFAHLFRAQFLAGD